MKSAIQVLFTLLVLAAFAAAAYNVFGDGYAVARMAEAAACAGGGPGCHVEGVLMIRTPVAHTYDFEVKRKPVHVRCMRAYVLAGDYACTAEGPGVQGR